MIFSDDDLKRLKELMVKQTQNPLPWTPSIIDGELWSIEDASKNRHEVITCDSGVYGPGVPTANLICEAINNLGALLARLEAAEKVINIGDGSIAPSKWAKYQNAMDAWRKAAGK